MTFEVAFNIVLAITSTLFGGLIRYLFTEIKELRTAVQAVRTEYQRRDDARRDNDQLLDLLREVKRSVEHIDQKLDRKADKRSS
ncbi:TPA: hypothetical protein MAQ46_003922 [Klebsiella pneumoniae]|uniref:hypothetical protein n=1 Tax=Klebsiella/Raoultella group TaxID=2890311 RepID=UPI0002500B10|nr:hypothetical protein [Raoultella ornithinolytica]HBS7326705.1 hypothetical protein [Klebsiella pneumoniae]EHT03176.1 hypothetical protein HMPREF9690_05286 [Raoultella ornithinolytica 10-5246]HDQ4779691.1 hypothetical protein [Klebsiella pneumoniae]HDQ4789480.1 hypothetical protein [Klebsiella pneumoniae]HDQ4795422.1 hypothetical protein [Klebsiella pneumoniae]